MNKTAKLLIVVVAAASLVSLTGCSKKPRAGEGDNGGYGSDASQSYGANGSDGFKVNAMTAPSDQTYYFGFNDSGMRPEDTKALNIQANYLASHSSAKVRLEGNTDSRGSREYNIGLGWHRDQTVARAMEQQGVQANQIQMVSYGKESPAVQGNDEHAWALNRRVDFIYKQKG
jgi:peptidoglycan-associated lipoprotein